MCRSRVVAIKTLASPQSCTAQRIRVGVTGLAAIFLMVMVAAAGMRPTPPVAPVEAPSETLAMLGVAPSVGTVAPVDRVSPPLAQPAKRPTRL